MSKKKTYVEFFFRGVLFDETSVREVQSRDVEKLEVPKNAFGFQFFDVLTTTQEGVELTSDRLNESPMHYYGGRIMTLEEVRAEMPDATTLISNMEGNGYDRVIRCTQGNFKPFEDGDIYVEI